jgi:hypothetical protein
MFLSLHEKVRLGRKCLPEKNTLGYLSEASAARKKGFIPPHLERGVVEMAILKIALNAFIFFQVDQLEHGLNDKMIPIAIKHKLYLTYRYFNSIHVHPVLSHT